MERQTGIESAEIMTAVAPADSSGSAEFIFSLGRQLYAATPSETEAHPLYPKIPCAGGDAYLSDLTRDGVWFGCGQGDGIHLVKLSTDPSMTFPPIKIDKGVPLPGLQMIAIWLFLGVLATQARATKTIVAWVSISYL